MQNQQKTSRPPIAVVGVSALFPGSLEEGGFWRDILAGRDQITDVPPSHWLIEDYYDPNPAAPDKTYARRGAFLRSVDFDALGWGVPPSIIPATDTSQLLALIVAQRVLADAARARDIDRSRISVILGVTSAQELLATMVSRLQRPVWVKALREAGVPEAEVVDICDRISAQYVPWQESTFPGVLGNVVAGRIANRLDLGGTNCVTDAACASTFSALAMGVNELYLGDSDMVIAGGVDTMNDIFMYMCFSKTPALSESGDCRPFSDAADGTMLGEGLGMFALKRLDDAERDNDRIYAVIRGVGSSSDGRAKSVYAPLAHGQARAIRRAYELAGYGPDTVEFIEAHGTGTKAGDAAEFEGLQVAFDEAGRTDRQWCALGSVKSQIGHTKSAAGAAGLFKAVLAVHARTLPPTIKVDRPNPKLNIEKSPFYLNTQARPWVRGGAHPRRAGVSSFGFGGSNFHITLEEYTGPEALRAPRLRGTGRELVVLTGEDVARQARQHAQAASAEGYLAWLSRHSLQNYSATAPRRLAIVATDEADLATKLLQAAERIEKDAGAPFATPTGIHYGVGASAGPVALLFPGQGSQYVGMGGAQAMHLEAAMEAWDLAADQDFGEGTGLPGVVFPLPVFTKAEEEAQQALLTETRWAQPAIGAASLATLKVLRGLGIEATAVGGHSYGEVTALYAAGALSERDLLRVARKRGELMGEAARIPGAMLAVPQTIEQVQAFVQAQGLDVVVANHNHPTQVVLSGSVEAIEAAGAALKGAGVRARRLSVATAFHSSIVSPSAAPFAEWLSAEIEVQAPAIPAFANATAQPYPEGAAAIRSQLAAQLAQPVRFVEMIEAMYAAGARVFVECGPDAVLTGLVDRILGDRPHVAVATDRRGAEDLKALLTAVAQLAAAGVAMQPAALWAGYRVPLNPHEQARPRVAVPINGSNSGKPYPPPGGAAALPPPNPPRPEPEPRIIHVEVPVEVPVQVFVPVAAEPHPTPRDEMSPPDKPAPARAVAQPVAPDLAWIEAWQAAQQQTAEAHAAYQRAVADAHTAFLKTAEASFIGLSAMISGGFAHQPQLSAQPQPQPQLSAPPPQPATWTPAPTPAPAPVAAAPAPAPAPAPVFAATPAPALRQAPAPAAVAAPKPAPVAPVAAAPVRSARPATDLNALLMAVVADKTGYPAEMLSAEMSLEGDLGIDSIKRVEILSAMQEKDPSLPEVDAGAMASLQTLGQIVSYMHAQVGGGTLNGHAAAPASAPAAQPKAAASAPASNGVDLTSLLLSVVADKTGYPAEMLSMEMSLEGDLGIDSIKRVEILSAMQEKDSSLPEVDAGAMASLQTLGQIVSYMGAQIGGDSSAPAVNGTSKGSDGGGRDLTALLLSVVADKTGYPAEMLSMEMSLEGDLGIDSIKRVEILSAMQEKDPSLPEVDAGAMASLQTLGQIVSYMGEQGGNEYAPVPFAGVSARGDSDVIFPDNLGRFAMVAEEVATAGMTSPGLLDGQRAVVTRDDSGVAEALVVVLGRHGVEARVVDAVPPEAEAVIFLGGLSAQVDERVNQAAFEAARAVASRFAESGGLFVAVQDTGGAFGLTAFAPERAWSAGLAALARTAAQEWPSASVKAIDLERGGRSAEALAEVLAAELLAGGPEREVGLTAAGRRLVLRDVRGPRPQGESLLGASDVVVVSGGARGVTAASVVALARESHARFVLLGRSALEEEPACVRGLEGDAELKRALLADAKARGAAVKPADLGRQVGRILANREILDTLRQIRAAGGEGRYVSVDVVDAAGLEAALAGVAAEWGPVTAIIHGAGVIADKRIQDKPVEDFAWVFRTKVDGLRAMLHATRAAPLKAILLFSSVAARCGNVGQVDYAMANEVLNKVARAEAQRRGPACRVRSLGWGPWEGGMVSPQLKARFEALGVALIPLDVGAQMLVDELRAEDDGNVEVVLGGAPRPEALIADGHGTPPELLLELRVGRASHPHLAAHAIQGVAVVPVVLAVEWFTRAARAARPDLHLVELSDLKVLRGIRLERYEDSGDLLRLRCRQLSNGDGVVLGLELRGAAGALHYTATAKMSPRPPSAVGLRAPVMPSLEAWTAGGVYSGEGVLFHGPAFQVIEAVEGVSDAGISASLGGVHSAEGWPVEAWHTDPAAMDGGLQLALLWAERVLGGASLPTGIGRVRTWSSTPPRGPLRGVLQGRTFQRGRAVSDITLLGPDGLPFAELAGVETHLLPGAPAPARS